MSEHSYHGATSRSVGVRRYLRITHCPQTSDTYQDLVGWFCDGGQDVDALGGEVSLGAGVDVLAVAPAGRHHRLPTLLVQHDQVALAETEERRALTCNRGQETVTRHKREREMFYLTTHSTHFIYGVRHMVKDHSDSEKGNQTVYIESKY